MNEGQSETRLIGSDLGDVRKVHRFSREAMATVFEVIIRHEDSNYARQASLAAFELLGGLEGELSRYIENSDISRINNLKQNESIVVGPAAFECLQLCEELYGKTNGAFDVTVGSLMGYWAGRDKGAEEELKEVMQSMGMNLIKLDEEGHTVEIEAEGVEIDLGGMGKGYAVDKMAEVFGEWGIESGLIHGGHSTVLGLGEPEGKKGWPVTLSNPANRKEVLVKLCLAGRAASGSGLEKGEHIIDPRTGRPAGSRIAAWAIADSAAVADGLSTAFMVMGAEEIEGYCEKNPQTLAMVMDEEGEILRFGPWEREISS